MKQEFNIDYFISKFEAIPESDIGRGVLERQCALWHCGVRNNSAGDYVPTEEAVALINIMQSPNNPTMSMEDVIRMPVHAYQYVYHCNDGNSHQYYQFGDTPKDRMINFLKAIKAGNHPLK